MQNEDRYLTATYRTLSSVSALKTRSGKTLIKLEENSLSSETKVKMKWKISLPISFGI